MQPGQVMGVSIDDQHRFSKTAVAEVVLVEGLGIDGDAHAGVTVRHRSRVARDPSQPNLRQVHLLHDEFLDEAREAGFDVDQGSLGENILTRGVDLLALPQDTRLRLGDDAVVRVTGLRNPCVQIDEFRPGLLGFAVFRDETGATVRRSGIMSVVVRGGRVRPGDRIHVDLPPVPHAALEVV